jgi:hypothetical protein
MLLVLPVLVSVLLAAVVLLRWVLIEEVLAQLLHTGGSCGKPDPVHSTLS